MSSITQVKEISRPIIEANAAYLIEVVFGNQGREKVIEIFIDSDQGVTADMCASISREVSQALDAGNLFADRYHLIVSSPGSDRPLKLQRQYKKHIGRTLSVKTKSGNVSEQIQGELTEVNEGRLSLRLKDNSIRTIEFETIVEAFVKTIW